MRALTKKQEQFCVGYIETSNASEAYRRAYDASRMKPESVWRKAVEVMENVKVAARIAELQRGIAKRNEITLDDLVRELEEARVAAMTSDKPNASAAVAATMGKAKLLGHGVERVQHEGGIQIHVVTGISR